MVVVRQPVCVLVLVVCSEVPEAVEKRHGPRVAARDTESPSSSALPPFEGTAGEQHLQEDPQQGAEKVSVGRQAEAHGIREGEHSLPAMVQWREELLDRAQHPRICVERCNLGVRGGGAGSGGSE